MKIREGEEVVREIAPAMESRGYGAGRQPCCFMSSSKIRWISLR
jgi:hypothetical protein